jgi:hypothetical protein
MDPNVQYWIPVNIPGIHWYWIGVTFPSDGQGLIAVASSLDSEYDKGLEYTKSAHRSHLRVVKLYVSMTTFVLCSAVAVA